MLTNFKINFMNKYSLIPKPWEKQERYSVRVIHHFDTPRAVYDEKITGDDAFDNAIVTTQTISYLAYYDDIETALKDYQNKILELKDNPEAYCPYVGQRKILTVAIRLKDKEEYGLFDWSRDGLYKHEPNRIHPDEELASNQRYVYLSCKS